MHALPPRRMGSQRLGTQTLGSGPMWSATGLRPRRCLLFVTFVVVYLKGTPRFTLKTGVAFDDCFWGIPVRNWGCFPLTNRFGFDNGTKISATHGST